MADKRHLRIGGLQCGGDEVVLGEPRVEIGLSSSGRTTGVRTVRGRGRGRGPSVVLGDWIDRGVESHRMETVEGEVVERVEAVRDVLVLRSFVFRGGCYCQLPSIMSNIRSYRYMHVYLNI